MVERDRSEFRGIDPVDQTAHQRNDRGIGNDAFVERCRRNGDSVQYRGSHRRPSSIHRKAVTEIPLALIV